MGENGKWWSWELFYWCYKAGSQNGADWGVTWWHINHFLKKEICMWNREKTVTEQHWIETVLSGVFGFKVSLLGKFTNNWGEAIGLGIWRHMKAKHRREMGSKPRWNQSIIYQSSIFIYLMNIYMSIFASSIYFYI